MSNTCKLLFALFMIKSLEIWLRVTKFGRKKFIFIDNPLFSLFFSTFSSVFSSWPSLGPHSTFSSPSWVKRWEHLETWPSSFASSSSFLLSWGCSFLEKVMWVSGKWMGGESLSNYLKKPGIFFLQRISGQKERVSRLCQLEWSTFPQASIFY